MYKAVLQGSPDSWTAQLGYFDCLLPSPRDANVARLPDLPHDADVASGDSDVARLSLTDTSSTADEAQHQVLESLVCTCSLPS